MCPPMAPLAIVVKTPLIKVLLPSRGGRFAGGFDRPEDSISASSRGIAALVGTVSGRVGP